jgi:ribose 5-phosphate isomerase B
LRISVGSDHAGFLLKKELVSVLTGLGHVVFDLGCFSTDSVDYPGIAAGVARAVAAGTADRGVIICGTGIGSCIVANKIPGVRAALCHDLYSARVTREHNDSNVLCLGARVIGPDLAVEILKVWLATAFTGAERHRRRVGQIADIEAEYCKGRPQAPPEPGGGR